MIFAHSVASCNRHWYGGAMNVVRIQIDPKTLVLSEEELLADLSYGR